MGIFIPLLQSLEFWSYPSNHWNSGPNFIHIGILMSSIQLFFFWPYLALYTLQFLSYSSKRWNSDPVFIHIGILPSKDWNSAPIFIITGILILSFPPLQALEFWPSFYKQWKSHLILLNTGVLIHIGCVILFFKRLRF